MKTTPVPSSERLIGLQALRAVAALMVVFHHARLSVPNSVWVSGIGECGVDIFFVISGFVMAYTTSQLPSTAAIGVRIAAARDFFVNRLLRVVPLYWLAIAWTARHGYGSKFTLASLLQDAVFIPHLNLEYPQSVLPFMIQGWTLNYEMFFYLLFALSLLSAKGSKLILIGAIVALVGVGVYAALGRGIPATDEAPVWRGAGTGGMSVWIDYYTNNIMLEFGFGLTLETALRRFAPLEWPRWCFMVLMIAGFVALLPAHSLWPRGLMQGLPAALIVWAGIGTFSGISARGIAALGDASYSIYLFHWASFALLTPLMSRVGASASGGLTIVLIAAHVAVAAISGLVIHRIVEKPLTRWLKRHVAHRMSREPLAAASP